MVFVNVTFDFEKQKYCMFIKIFEQQVEMVNGFRIKAIMALDAIVRYKSSEILASDSIKANEMRDRNETNEWFNNEIGNRIEET